MEDPSLAIDKYAFDSGTESGGSDFSVLKGMLVYTSGLIGRADPLDVHSHTPAGAIGIRGTIITGEVTEVKGAIVLHDFNISPLLYFLPPYYVASAPTPLNLQ